VCFATGRSPSGEDFGGNHLLSSVYPKSGYGNAPKFCENTDKAVATYSFNVPRNLSPGQIFITFSISPFTSKAVPVRWTSEKTFKSDATTAGQCFWLDAV